MASLKRLVLDLIFPRRCVSCNKAGDFLCESCKSSVRLITPPICECCGRPVKTGRFCDVCYSDPPLFDGVRSATVFGGVVREAIHAMKYKGIRAVVPDLAAMMYDYFQHYPVPGDVIVPVPLHEKRLRERGFNQSALLASELARLTGLEIISDCLVRTRYSSPQAKSSSLEERRRNVRESFRCADGRLAGRRVLLIDDVCTSRSTLAACTMPLREAEVRSIWGFTLATEGMSHHLLKKDRP